MLCARSCMISLFLLVAIAGAAAPRSLSSNKGPKGYYIASGSITAIKDHPIPVTLTVNVIDGTTLDLSADVTYNNQAQNQAANAVGYTMIGDTIKLDDTNAALIAFCKAIHDDILVEFSPKDIYLTYVEDTNQIGAKVVLGQYNLALILNSNSSATIDGVIQGTYEGVMSIQLGTFELSCKGTMQTFGSKLNLEASITFNMYPNELQIKLIELEYYVAGNSIVLDFDSASMKKVLAYVKTETGISVDSTNIGITIGSGDTIKVTFSKSGFTRSLVLSQARKDSDPAWGMYQGSYSHAIQLTNTVTISGAIDPTIIIYSKSELTFGMSVTINGKQEVMSPVEVGYTMTGTSINLNFDDAEFASKLSKFATQIGITLTKDDFALVYHWKADVIVFTFKDAEIIMYHKGSDAPKPTDAPVTTAAPTGGSSATSTKKFPKDKDFSAGTVPSVIVALLAAFMIVW